MTDVARGRRTIAAERGILRDLRSSRARRAVAALALGLPAACAGAHVDSAPRILADAWPRLEVPAQVRATPADTPSTWTLDAALEQIAGANPTLGVAQARLEEAQAVRREAVSAYFPELSLGLDYLSTDNPAQAFAVLLNQEKLSLGPTFDATPGSVENWRKEVRLDWPLFAPGREATRHSARENETAAQLAGDAVQCRLLNAGVQAWIGLRAARDLEQVAWESIAVVERRLEQTRRRQEEGAALHADVLRLEVRLATARQQAARATLSVRQAESALNHLMGRAPDAALALADEAIEVGATLPEDLETLLASAEAGRQDLRAAVHGVRGAAFEREGASAGRYPTLQAFAAYGYDGTDPAIDGDLDSYVVGVGLRLPFSARTDARIDQARARERGAREELRELALSIAREVRDGWEELRVARQTLALAQSAVGAADEAFRIVAEAQDAGGATVTDVLEAEDARKGARVRQVAAQAGVQIALAKLAAATGTVR